MKSYYNTIFTMLWLLYAISVTRATRHNTISPNQYFAIKSSTDNLLSLCTALALKYHQSDSVMGSKFIYFQNIFIKLSLGLTPTDVNRYPPLAIKPIEFWYDICQGMMIALRREEFELEYSDGLEYIQHKYPELHTSIEYLSRSLIYQDKHYKGAPEIVERHISTMYTDGEALVARNKEKGLTDVQQAHLRAIRSIHHTVGLIYQFGTRVGTKETKFNNILHENNIGVLGVDSEDDEFSALSKPQGAAILSHVIREKLLNTKFV